MQSSIEKSGSMYAGIFFVWVACLFYFDPRLFNVLNGDETPLVVTAYLLFVALTNLFWLYGIYHCFFWLYRLLPEKVFASPRPRSSGCQRIAILYTVRNDFKREAGLSCLRQSHPDFHVYLLDDSTDEEYKATIDAFQREHPDKTSVVRRSDRRGYKAGNLNNALRNHATDCVYFAVVDADEVIPPDFLDKTIPYFALGDDIAFVQANHEQNPRQPSRFADDLALGIAYHWNVYQPPRNEHGFVMFYGHGAVIRRDLWEMVGGFPEIVSEDLAFATRLRQQGYGGYFVRDITCYEDFPETFQQFRRRHEKWVKGACQYLHREFLPFLTSRNVTLPEKVDVLMSCFSLFLPAMFLIFVLTTNATLPILLAEPHAVTLAMFGRDIELIPAYFLEPIFKDLWTLDFYLITLVGMFAPVFVYLGGAFRSPARIFRLLFKSAVPYISLVVVSAIGIFSYLVTRRAAFPATGDKVDGTGSVGLAADPGFLTRLDTNQPFVFGIEFFLGIALTYLSVMTVNFALLTISTSLLLSPLVAKYGWDKRAISALVSLPLAFVLLAFGSMGMGFLGMQGFSLFFVALHF